MKDSYHTLSSLSQGEFKDRGSKFIAYTLPVKNEDEVKMALDDIAYQHPKSRHVCYAYRLGVTGEIFRINDDGEPSGSAGRPILNQLLSNDLTYTLAAVVRYFGGTKLGVPGLIQAYKESTRDAISQNQIIKKYDSQILVITFGYDKMGDLLNHIKQLDIEMIEKKFDANPSIIISIRKSLVEEKLTKLKAKLLQISDDRITPKTSIDGIDFQYID